ncbi:hypothetical protein SAMD00023353_1101680 [Rosellinia necatrix]|uniref:Uncharacterized protein n=1 Tax=Rosellinia necatrix TaxID=77044 RepID=A0A1S8A6I9_ROSNE|nr:hypothetical protein SAMD00023353_1101680 [Rosellinia necatrix]
MAEAGPSGGPGLEDHSSRPRSDRGNPRGPNPQGVLGRRERLFRFLERRRQMHRPSRPRQAQGPFRPPADRPPANQSPANQSPANQPPANQPPANQPSANQSPQLHIPDVRMDGSAAEQEMHWADRVRDWTADVAAWADEMRRERRQRRERRRRESRRRERRQRSGAERPPE